MKTYIDRTPWPCSCSLEHADTDHFNYLLYTLTREFLEDYPSVIHLSMTSPFQTCADKTPFRVGHALLNLANKADTPITTGSLL
jgi:hypothetical protein